MSWRISSAVALVGTVDVTGATVGGLATSRIRSAMSASCDNERWSDEEASTILTDGGRRCKNNCWTKALSGAGPESPRSCCILRRS